MDILDPALDKLEKERQAEDARQRYAKKQMIKRYGRPVQEMVVVDINMPFWSMVTFMLKWAIASIPAALLFFLFLVGVGAILQGLGVAFFVGFRECAVSGGAK